MRCFSAFIIAFVTFCASPALSGDYQKGVEAYQRSDWRGAIKEFRELAEQGGINAQYTMGLMYEQGLGVAEDADEAKQWYLRAAKKDKAEAQYRLGLLYEAGTNGGQDIESALIWYRRAASQKFAAAEYKLRSAYHLGRGVAKDAAVAKLWLQRAANHGDTEAQIVLGEMLFAEPQNNAAAYMWVSIAAASGNKAAAKKKRYFAVFMTPNQIIEGQKLAQKWKAQFATTAKR